MYNNHNNHHHHYYYYYYYCYYYYYYSQVNLQAEQRVGSLDMGKNRARVESLINYINDRSPSLPSGTCQF